LIENQNMLESMKYHLDQSDEMDKKHLALWGLKDIKGKKNTNIASPEQDDPA